MTNKTLEHFATVAPQAKHYMDYLKGCLAHYRENEMSYREIEKKTEIYGALNALERVGIITQLERRILFTYYTL